jgi:hypothetical protein
MGNQPNSSQNQQKQLQNNQLPQETNSLKRQLKEQEQKQQEIKKEFESSLLSNNNFQSQHQLLLKQGYDITNSSLNPSANDTGTFEIKYNNMNGKWATLAGKMKNGTVTEIEQQTQVKQEKLLEKIKEDATYQQYDKKLVAKGFSQNNVHFKENGNETAVNLRYEDKKHDNANITVNFVNEQIKRLSLDDGENKSLNLIWLLVISVFVGSGFIIYVVIKKLKYKKRFTDSNLSSAPMLESFDYVTQSKELLNAAKQYFNDGNYKEAFATAGKSIRLFLSHHAGIKKEVSNEELVRLLQHDNYPVDEIRECLKIAEYVEFANSKATEDDLQKIVSLFNKLSEKFDS